jgi:hypothetical protein
VFEWMLRQGQDFRFDIQRLYKDFEECVYVHRKNLVELIEALTANGKRLSVIEHLQRGRPSPILRLDSESHPIHR